MENVFDSLPPHLAASAKAIVAKREAQGLNVHFEREDGTADRFSFRNAERADAFRASLKRQGRKVIK